MSHQILSGPIESAPDAVRNLAAKHPSATNYLAHIEGNQRLWRVQLLDAPATMPVKHPVHAQSLDL